MKGLLVFLLCLASFVAGGWVAGPWLVDRAVDHFVDRLGHDPDLAGRVASALIASPAFREAVTAELRKRGVDVARLDFGRLQQGMQALIGLLGSPEFQKYMVQEQGQLRGQRARERGREDDEVRARAQKLVEETKKRLAGATSPQTLKDIGRDIQQGIQDLFGGSPGPSPAAPG